jgi:hypothetical protein
MKNVRAKSHPQQWKMSSKETKGKKPLEESEVDPKLLIAMTHANPKFQMGKPMLTIGTLKEAGKSYVILHNYYCRSGFTTLPPVPLQEQPAVVLLLEGHRSLRELAIRDYGGHKDLHGSGCRSVIPYVHG